MTWLFAGMVWVAALVFILLAFRMFTRGERTTACTCFPCTTPAYGAPGVAHCAACCYGSLIEEYDHNCPVPEHRAMAQLQYPIEKMIE